MLNNLVKQTNALDYLLGGQIGVRIRIHFPEGGDCGSWLAFVDACGDLGEGDVGACDGEGVRGNGERISKRIFSNNAQSCDIVFPSRSY